MRMSTLLPLFILSLASVGASAADLAASIASDLAAAEQHIIPNTTAYITQTGASNIGLISQEARSRATSQTSASSAVATVQLPRSRGTLTL